MTLYNLLQTCNIQGSYIIKAWDDRKDDYIVLQCGTDAEIELYNLSAYITGCRIDYIYAVDGVLNIELKIPKRYIGFYYKIDKKRTRKRVFFYCRFYLVTFVTRRYIRDKFNSIFRYFHGKLRHFSAFFVVFR